MVSYKVVAPYVTLKVKDHVGNSVVQGFHAGGIVHDVVDEDQAKAQADLGLLEEWSPPAEEEPEEILRPAGNASQEAWATYALESGQASEDEVAGLTRDELRELYG